MYAECFVFNMFNGLNEQLRIMSSKAIISKHLITCIHSTIDIYFKINKTIVQFCRYFPEFIECAKEFQYNTSTHPSCEEDVRISTLREKTLCKSPILPGKYHQIQATFIKTQSLYKGYFRPVQFSPFYSCKQFPPCFEFAQTLVYRDNLRHWSSTILTFAR